MRLVILPRKKNGAPLFRYAYDSLNQFVREDNTLSGRTYVYEYDSAGNIKSKKTYDYTTATTVSTTLRSTQTHSYDSSRSMDILIAFNGDNIFLLRSAVSAELCHIRFEWILTWQGRQLESYTDSESEETFTYTYNSDGIGTNKTADGVEHWLWIFLLTEGVFPSVSLSQPQYWYCRTSKTVDGVEHIYHLSGTQVLSEEWNDGTLQYLLIYIYDVSGSPIGMAYCDSTYVSGDFDIYMFAKNIQGDILYIYNTSGTRLVTYTYDAWGNVTTSYSNGGASTAARYNPFRCCGYWY